ncbi:hypothetical protein NECAME_09274 [Necator americanus]|uniref:Uncharacterized protein n=1 Tax=Necator americanus TaxID=51031 RepID=W2TGN6_NECAM|nr:hypothetical protein NECAME_09274 [Necator americanus]ETN80336.1 hypothetical protein NECAME_09274 [Necator americanus]
MALMGAQVHTISGRGPYCHRIHDQICHRLGALHPHQGGQRQFGQIYILDTEMAAQQLLRKLSEKIGKPYQFAWYSLIRERGFARGQYAIPTANEVAVVYVGEENDVPASRSLAVHLRQAAGSTLMSISDIDKRCDLLTYPLLFPTGRGGWDPNLVDNDGAQIAQMK